MNTPHGSETGEVERLLDLFPEQTQNENFQIKACMHLSRLSHFYHFHLLTRGKYLS